MLQFEEYKPKVELEIRTEHLVMERRITTVGDIKQTVHMVFDSCFTFFVLCFPPFVLTMGQRTPKSPLGLMY